MRTLKDHTTFSIKLRMLICSLILAWTVTSPAQSFGQSESTNSVKSLEEDVAFTLKELNTNSALFWPFRDKLLAAANARQRTIQCLMEILNDPKSKSITKRYAAYYLGELRAGDAVDTLATQITLSPNGPIGGSLGEMESPWNGSVAAWALGEIGMPSIPALIRNLAERDDGKVRELSLQMLCWIERDNDIVQLRLQKALKAEKDAQKQARLQSALKALAPLH